MGSTALWWLIMILIILIFVVAKFRLFEKENKKDVTIVTIYLIWNIFSVIRGTFVAETYWDWKGLIGNAFALLIPVIVYTASNNSTLQSILSFFVKYCLIISIPVLITFPMGYWGWYFFPISLLVLFLPTLKTFWKVLLILISFVAIFGDLSVRSHVIKYFIPFLLLGIYYFRHFMATDKVIRIVRKVFIITPWIFLVLGVTGIFNIFLIKEYVKASFVPQSTNAEGETKEQDITEDSRTFIYYEVLTSAINHNYWILGRSPARGNDTTTFAKSMEEITGRRERLRNEAGVPNIFTWTGIIGIIFYFLVFLKASRLAVYNSKNIFIKLIGLFVAFRWLYGWVEDDASFTMNTFVIWFMIAICFSKSLRDMNNFEVKLWARGIFENNYSMLLKALKKDEPKIKMKVL